MSKAVKKQQPPSFEPEKLYRIRLSRTVTFNGVRLRPFDTHMVKGKIAQAIEDAITQVEALD
jgi:putative protein kinase ArgK-like GTPase of G3E family